MIVESVENIRQVKAKATVVCDAFAFSLTAKIQCESIIGRLFDERDKIWHHFFQRFMQSYAQGFFMTIFRDTTKIQLICDGIKEEVCHYHHP